MITTGGEGHFYWKDQNVGFWYNGAFVSDYNFNGQGIIVAWPSGTSFLMGQFYPAGEDFDADLQLDDIDFGTYVCQARKPMMFVTLIHFDEQHLYPQYWSVLF